MVADLFPELDDFRQGHPSHRGFAGITSNSVVP
jgi:hypothetical protein